MTWISYLEQCTYSTFMQQFFILTYYLADGSVSCECDRLANKYLTIRVYSLIPVILVILFIWNMYHRCSLKQRTTLLYSIVLHSISKLRLQLMIPRKHSVLSNITYKYNGGIYRKYLHWQQVNRYRLNLWGIMRRSPPGNQLYIQFAAVAQIKTNLFIFTWQH